MRGGLLAAVLLAGCALRPGSVGSEARVEAMRMLTVEVYDRNAPWRTEAERRRDAGTGLRALAAAGRVVVGRCALSGYEVVFHLAVLPAGMTAPAEGAFLRVRLGDAGAADAVLGAADGLAAGDFRRIRAGAVVGCTR